MEIYRTDPVAEGRYLVFTSIEGAREWCGPIVILWSDGAWRYPYSKEKFPRKVHGHSGLLPMGKLCDLFPEDFAPPPGLEYDL